MKINRDVLGWRIEPSTNDEESALAFLFSALEEQYCNSKEATDTSLASHLPLEAPIPNMEMSK
jgi:hypothetical protein